jgi:hypothetical protein
MMHTIAPSTEDNMFFYKMMLYYNFISHAKTMFINT